MIPGVEFSLISLSRNILPCVASGSQRDPVARRLFATFVALAAGQASRCVTIPDHIMYINLSRCSPRTPVYKQLPEDVLTHFLVSFSKREGCTTSQSDAATARRVKSRNRDGKAQSCGRLPHRPRVSPCSMAGMTSTAAAGHRVARTCIQMYQFSSVLPLRLTPHTMMLQVTAGTDCSR